MEDDRKSITVAVWSGKQDILKNPILNIDDWDS